MIVGEYPAGPDHVIVVYMPPDIGTEVDGAAVFSEVAADASQRAASGLRILSMAALPLRHAGAFLGRRAAATRRRSASGSSRALARRGRLNLRLRYRARVTSTKGAAAPRPSSVSSAGRPRAIRMGTISVAGRRARSPLPRLHELWRWSVDQRGRSGERLGPLRVTSTTNPAGRPRRRPQPGARGSGRDAELRGARAPPAGPRADDVVVLGRSQTRADVDLTATELRARWRAAVGAAPARRPARRSRSPRSCQRAESIVALLATASIGRDVVPCAPSSACGPSSIGRADRAQGVLAIDGYRYGDKAIDRRA